jgi:hypothetical protein
MMGRTSQAAFAVVMPVGPGELELERVADTLESLHHFEPDVTRVVLVNDAPEARPELLDAAGSLASSTTIVQNHRDRSADGWSEGVLTSVATGMLEVSTGSPSVEWALKLDTDALIINPFARSISERFASDPTIGLMGTNRCDIHGRPRDMRASGRPVRRLRAPISLWRRQRRMRTTLYGVSRERRQVIDEALRHGYIYGDHCQGGAYALSIGAIDGLAARGWLDCRLWRGTLVAEDVIMGVQVSALGLKMVGMADRGEPFAVEHIGLPDAPEALRDAGYGIIHSIKGQGDLDEAQIRELFSRIRLDGSTITEGS